MLFQSILTLFTFISSLAITCTLPSGTYNCKDASISDLDKKNVVIHDITIKNSDIKSISNWSATGDVWVSTGENEGYFEKQPLVYTLDLTSGIHTNESTYSVCNTTIHGPQVTWGWYFANPGREIYTPRIAMTSLDKTKEIQISKFDSGDIFTCQLQ